MTVELITLDPTIKLDIRYASTNNFLSAPLYKQPRAFLERPAAEALVRVHKGLEKQGYGLGLYLARTISWGTDRTTGALTNSDGKVTLAVILGMKARGFEGSDRLFLAVTRVLDR